MIYIATHKAVNFEPMPNFALVQVGAALHDPLPYLSDATGDNISHLNPQFCELTALYWIWKNSTEEFKGLAHYRRFFATSSFSSDLSNILSHSQLVDLLSDADIVLPKPLHLLENVEEELQRWCCSARNLSLLRQEVETQHPESMEAFNQVFAGNLLSICNMMFCRAQLFDNYCNWLFSILLPLVDKVDLSNANPYQQRLMGFLSERLLNVYVREHNLRVAYVPMMITDTSIFKILREVRRNITNEIRFRLFH